MKEKKLTHHEIIDRIAEETEQKKCARNQNCEFIRTYGCYICYLLIHLNSVINVLQDWLSIIVMNDADWVKSYCSFLKKVHF